MPEQEFGCARCWPAEADAAWNSRHRLERLHELIDESHFHVMVLGCPHCRQRFLSVFSETIDWADGEDPQYWTMLPLLEDEAQDLAARSKSLSEPDLDRLGPGRRSLRRDHPKDGPGRLLWSRGVCVGLHD